MIIEGLKRFGNDIIRLATLLPKRSFASVKARVARLRKTTTNSQMKKVLAENKRTVVTWTEKEIELLISLCQRFST